MSHYRTWSRINMTEHISPQHPVGVIGTGLIGEPVAANLLAAGYPVTVFNRTRAKAERLINHGATWAESPADLARSVRVVISVVSDSPDVEAVYLG
ncbi:MAG: NAD(P)-binding domain-containing protein, partial [Phycisphaerae bacterium]